MDYSEITYKINGCAMKVHNLLGSGFQELIYQRSLAIELNDANLNFIREIDQDIFYKETHVGTRRADFIIEEKVILEIKALITLEEIHTVQIRNYLTAYDLP